MLGEVVRNWRKERRWSQEKLARKAGVTQQAVSYVERTGDAGRDLLIGLARAFNCSVDDLLRAAGLVASPQADELARLITELRSLGAVFAARQLERFADTLTPQDRAPVLAEARRTVAALRAQQAAETQAQEEPMARKLAAPGPPPMLINDGWAAYAARRDDVDAADDRERAASA